MRSKFPAPCQVLVRTKAKAIVKYRKSHGKFKSAQDLENVNGIGSKTVAKNKDNIML